jgi:hypothetical protein
MARASYNADQTLQEGAVTGGCGQRDVEIEIEVSSGVTQMIKPFMRDNPDQSTQNNKLVPAPKSSWEVMHEQVANTAACESDDDSFNGLMQGNLAAYLADTEGIGLLVTPAGESILDSGIGSLVAFMNEHIPPPE